LGAIGRFSAVIALFTDFGPAGPYVGQVKAVIHARAPAVPLVDLLADAPAWRVAPAAHLLAALIGPFPAGTVFLCVVDPGVGSDDRDPVCYRVDDRWFVGPGNGLFDVVAKRGRRIEGWRVDWRPQHLSPSFHGRDLFAPVAAMLATGERVAWTPLELDGERLLSLPDDLQEIIYIDHFGNSITGIRAERLDDSALVTAAGQRLGFARTFSAAAEGEAFWYRNSLGLVEISVNRGSAAEKLGLQVGDTVAVMSHRAGSRE
jgi:hypothetical protein